jgi:hypothetical protein
MGVLKREILMTGTQVSGTIKVAWHAHAGLPRQARPSLCLAVLPESDKQGWCRDYEMGPIEKSSPPGTSGPGCTHTTNTPFSNTAAQSRSAFAERRDGMEAVSDAYVGRVLISPLRIESSRRPIRETCPVLYLDAAQLIRAPRHDMEKSHFWHEGGGNGRDFQQKNQKKTASTTTGKGV